MRPVHPKHKKKLSIKEKIKNKKIVELIIVGLSKFLEFG